jgi:hypothetical protein
LKDVPTGGIVDPMAIASQLADYFAESMEDIEDIIAKECATAGISCLRK